MKINQIPKLYCSERAKKQENVPANKSIAGNSRSAEITAYYPHPSFFGRKKELTRAEINDVVKNSQPISEAGLKGTVYKAEKAGKTYAIKVAKSAEYDFKKEADILAKIPEDIGRSQKLVDYYKDSKTGKDILVTTFVSGEKGVLNGQKDFISFFDTLLKLDKAGVLHGDLNMQNCLFDDNGVNLIDFGEGEIFEQGNNYPDLMYPDFIVKSNSVNLEQNGIPDCLMTWNKNEGDVKGKFGQYLTAKSKYFKKHAQILEEAGSDKKAIDYEKNLSEVLKSPSEKIIKNELERIDILYTFEQADTAVNYEYSPKGAESIWNLTISKATEHKDNVLNTLKNDDLSAKERKYFEYQLEIAQKFEDTYKDWGSSTVDWINSLYSKPQNELSEHETKLMQNKDKISALPPDLCALI